MFAARHLVRCIGRFVRYFTIFAASVANYAIGACGDGSLDAAPTDVETWHQESISCSNWLRHLVARWVESVAGQCRLGYVLAALVHIFLLINLVAVGALVFIWLERKVSGRIQDRLGPTRVGGKFGWLQTLADGIKLITKEDLMPDGADELLFKLAPYVSFCASFAAFMALPFAGGDYAVCRAAPERRRVLHHRRAGAGSVRRDSGRLLVGVEVVAVRGDARSGPGRELRSAAGHVRRRAGADRRLDGPGGHRRRSRPAGSGTGSSSTIRSRSSCSGSTSPARRPA